MVTFIELPMPAKSVAAVIIVSGAAITNDICFLSREEISPDLTE